MRYIQARKFVPGWNDTKPFSALRYVSCTRSSASSRLCVSQCAKLYNEANIGIASVSKDSASVRRSITTQYGNSSPGPAETHSPGFDVRPPCGLRVWQKQPRITRRQVQSAASMEPV